MTAQPSAFMTGVAGALDEEHGALARLYEQQAPDALRLAFLLTGDRSLAEDLVQEAFARLVGRLVHLRDRDAVPAYLRRTVVNLSRMHARRRKVERTHLQREGRLLARPGEQPAGPGGDIETRQALARALSLLPERQRAALVLRFYEDLSERRVAEVLGCRLGTASSLVSRGLQALRSQMRSESHEG